MANRLLHNPKASTTHLKHVDCIENANKFTVTNINVKILKAQITMICGSWPLDSNIS
uniref:Uncharacterized protein n=1 Tax=Arundo donax TaxID=35708 RepID=A0A0A9AQ24_ARUDO